MERVRLVVEIDPIDKNSLISYCEKQGHSLRYVVALMVRKFLDDKKAKAKKGAKK